jgi:hypothetical protein
LNGRVGFASATTEQVRTVDIMGRRGFFWDLLGFVICKSVAGVCADGAGTGEVLSDDLGEKLKMRRFLGAPLFFLGASGGGGTCGVSWFAVGSVCSVS